MIFPSPSGRSARIAVLKTGLNASRGRLDREILGFEESLAIRPEVTRASGRNTENSQFRKRNFSAWLKVFGSFCFSSARWVFTFSRFLTAFCSVLGTCFRAIVRK